MNPPPTFPFRPPGTWAWLPLVLWHGGFLGGPAGAAGAAVGWIAGTVAGQRNAFRLSGVSALWAGPILAVLAQAVAFPVGNLAAGLLGGMWPSGAAAVVLCVQAAVSFAGIGLWLTVWTRVRPWLGWAAETMTGLAFALAPLAAHRDGGLTYPYWLTDGFSALGWPIHAGYFAAGMAFFGCLILRAKSRRGTGIGPGLVWLLVIPTAWFLFGQVRLPLVSAPPPENVPPPPDSRPESPPQESPRDAPPPPEEDHSYDALVRFRGLPPRCPVQWGGQYYRIEDILADGTGAEGAEGAVAEIYLFDDALDGPPVPHALVSGETIAPPPGVKRAYRTVSRIPDRGYDPELFPFYRMADQIGRVPPEALPEGWAWLDAVLPETAATPPDEIIAAVAKWLLANVVVEPDTLTPTGEQLTARTLPVRAETSACLEIAVRLLRSRGIAARIAAGYLVPFPERGQPPSDVLLLGSMRTTWLEIELGTQGWQPLPMALPGPPQAAQAEPDPELLQHVLELLRRSPPPERPSPGAPLHWVLILVAVYLMWRIGVTWRVLWSGPLTPGPIPAAGAVARALDLLAAAHLGQRAFGERCAAFALRLHETAPDLAAPMRRLAEALDVDYAVLPAATAPRRSPSPEIRATYAALLRAVFLRRPAFFLRFLLPGPVFHHNETLPSPPPWTPPTP